MANPFAGEVELSIDGNRQVMKLTLGALAELEASLKEGSLSDLVARFESGSFRSSDVLSLLVAGLRGAGWSGSEQDLFHADIEGGPVEAARVAAKLLVRAFSVPSDAGS